MRTDNLSVNVGGSAGVGDGGGGGHLCRLSSSCEHLLSSKGICEGGKLQRVVEPEGGGGVAWSVTCVRGKWRHVFELLASSQTPDTYERAEAQKSPGSSRRRRRHESDLERYSSVMGRRLRPKCQTSKCQ